jgi:hypothetical protein
LPAIYFSLFETQGPEPASKVFDDDRRLKEHNSAPVTLLT